MRVGAAAMPTCFVMRQHRHSKPCAVKKAHMPTFVGLGAQLLFIMTSSFAAVAAGDDGGPPANFSCAIGVAGLEFARHLQPERSNLSGVIAALVAPNCHSSVLATAAAPPSSRGDGSSQGRREQPGHGLWGWRQDVPDLPVLSMKGSCELHVDWINGKDTAGRGSVTSPFKTIAFAVSHIPSAQQPCTVVLAAGTHYVNQTVVINPEHKNLTIMPAANATAVISGGVELSGLQWQPVHPPAPGGYGGLGKARRGSPPATVKIMRAKLQGGVPQLRELFDAAGGRLVPARTPDNPDANDPFAVKTGNARVTAMRPFGNATVVENASWSRNFPFYSEGGGGSFFPVYRVGVGGPASWFSNNISYWAQTKVSGGQAATYQIPENISIESLPGPRLADKAGGLVFSTHCKGWGGWVFEIGAVDHATRANITNISFSRGGWQEARGCHGMGQFFVSHRLELLNQPNEWFYDDEEGYLYMGTDPNAAVVPSQPLVGPTVQTIFSVQGTQARPVRNFRISGVIFRHVAPAFLESYSVPSGGDYSVHRGGAVLLNGTEGCVIDHNLFDGCGGNGVVLNDYTRRAQVSANEFRRV